MRRIVLILLAVLAATPVLATGQAGDKIYVDGQLWELLWKPIDVDSVLYTSLSSCFTEDHCQSTGNWAGYIGCWSIKGDLLVLDSVTYELFVDGECEDVTLPDSTLKRVFHAYCENGMIVARWLTSDKIRLATGEMIRYEHMGFNRNYEHEMFLTLENGRITNRKLFHNRIVNKGFAFEDLSLEESHSLQQELGRIIRKYSQYDHQNKVYIQLAGIIVDTLGNLTGIDSVRVRYHSDNGTSNSLPSLENDIIRYLKSLGPWKVLYINGEYSTYSSNWLLPIRLDEIAEKPTWESLNKRPYPQWFGDAKLGIFVHWGLYSVPAYAGKEGYGEWLYKGLMARDPGRMKAMSYFADTTLPVFEQYKELTKYWHAELWNPQEWARMFKDAGARYVVLVTKHHDGYCLWDSPQQPQWNSTMSGPRRNIVAELTDAVRKEGLTMGFYYSLPEWSNPRHIWTVDSDSNLADYVDYYMVPQFKDLITRYKPELVFSDGDWDNTSDQWRSVELIDWYYRTVGPNAIVNDRWGRGTKHGFRTPEYSDGIKAGNRPWAECRGVGRSFGLNRNEDLDNYLTDRELIQHFCELVAHGGGLTLNVGPYADGTIPLIQQERLRAIGKWLQVNGEAIYGSRPFEHIEWYDYEHCSSSLPQSPYIDYDWVRNAPLKGMPVDHFTIEWEGDILVPETGDYLVRVEADDEVSVFSNDDSSFRATDGGELLMHYRKDWAENPTSERTFHLEKGKIWSLRLAYREGDLEATLRFTWSRDGGKTFEPVPTEWRGAAFWSRPLRCFTTRDDNIYVIEFERPDRTLTLSCIPKLKKGTRISLLGTTANLTWKQKKDGTLTIDLSDIDPKEMNALDHAWVFKITNTLTQ